MTSSGFLPLNLASVNNDPGVSSSNWVWTGSVSSSWNNAGNWNPASIPNGTSDNVTIPAVSNQPVLDIATVDVDNITIYSGAYLTIGNGNNLRVTGNFTNNNFNGANNGLTYSTTGTVTYIGTSTVIAPGNYYNLNASGATTPVLANAGTISIAGTFTPGSSAYTYTGSTMLIPVQQLTTH